MAKIHSQHSFPPTKKEDRNTDTLIRSSDLETERKTSQAQQYCWARQRQTDWRVPEETAEDSEDWRVPCWRLPDLSYLTTPLAFLPSKLAEYLAWEPLKEYFEVEYLEKSRVPRLAYLWHDLFLLAFETTTWPTIDTKECWNIVPCAMESQERLRKQPEAGYANRPWALQHGPLTWLQPIWNFSVLRSLFFLTENTTASTAKTDSTPVHFHFLLNRKSLYLGISHWLHTNTISLSGEKTAKGSTTTTMATDRDQNGNSSLAQGQVVNPLKEDQEP